jgi:hypothetical protein
MQLDVDVSADASQILTSHNGFESDGCTVEVCQFFFFFFFFFLMSGVCFV